MLFHKTTVCIYVCVKVCMCVHVQTSVTLRTSLNIQFTQVVYTYLSVLFPAPQLYCLYIEVAEGKIILCRRLVQKLIEKQDQDATTTLYSRICEKDEQKPMEMLGCLKGGNQNLSNLMELFQFKLCFLCL